MPKINGTIKSYAIPIFAIIPIVGLVFWTGVQSNRIDVLETKVEQAEEDIRDAQMERQEMLRKLDVLQATANDIDEDLQDLKKFWRIPDSIDR